MPFPSTISYNTAIELVLKKLRLEEKILWHTNPPHEPFPWIGVKYVVNTVSTTGDYVQSKY